MGRPVTKVPIPGVEHIIAIASGKGGVGKSTTAGRAANMLRDARNSYLHHFRSRLSLLQSI